MSHNYILQVTAGPGYDPKTHKIVPVNQPTPISVSSDLIDADVNVRIQVCGFISPLNLAPGSTDPCFSS